MTEQDIIRLLREAGIDPESDTLCNYDGWTDTLVDFAAIVAAAEREACAKVCDEREEVFQKYYTKGLPALCAEAIRARGQA
jgi:hypothetical protein